MELGIAIAGIVGTIVSGWLATYLANKHASKLRREEWEREDRHRWTESRHQAYSTVIGVSADHEYAVLSAGGSDRSPEDLQQLKDLIPVFETAIHHAALVTEDKAVAKALAELKGAMGEATNDVFGVGEQTFDPSSVTSRYATTVGDFVVAARAELGTKDPSFTLEHGHESEGTR